MMLFDGLSAPREQFSWDSFCSDGGAVRRAFPSDVKGTAFILNRQLLDSRVVPTTPPPPGMAVARAEVTAVGPPTAAVTVSPITRHIVGTTDQYNEGGPACCAASAVATTTLILSRGRIDAALLDEGVRRGARYKGQEQLFAMDLVEKEGDLNQIEFYQFENPTVMMNDFLMRVDRPQQVTAYIVTKQPEVVLLLQFQPGMLSIELPGCDRASWALVDSHPRRELGLNHASATFFNTTTELISALRGRQPFITIPDVDDPMYNVCEVIVLQLKRSQSTRSTVSANAEPPSVVIANSTRAMQKLPPPPVRSVPPSEPAMKAVAVDRRLFDIPPASHVQRLTWSNEPTASKVRREEEMMIRLLQQRWAVQKYIADISDALVAERDIANTTLDLDHVTKELLARSIEAAALAEKVRKEQYECKNSDLTIESKKEQLALRHRMRGSARERQTALSPSAPTAVPRDACVVCHIALGGDAVTLPCCGKTVCVNEINKAAHHAIARHVSFVECPVCTQPLEHWPTLGASMELVVKVLNRRPAKQTFCPQCRSACTQYCDSNAVVCTQCSRSFCASCGQVASLAQIIDHLYQRGSRCAPFTTSGLHTLEL